MDNERTEYIRGWLTKQQQSTKYDPTTRMATNFCWELLNSLEASQQKLAEAEEWKDTWKDRCRFGIAKLRERKKELAWAEASIANWVDYVEYMTGDRNNYRERWREAEAEAERLQGIYDLVMSEKCPSDEIHCSCVPILRIEIAGLRAQLAASQAEVERLQSILDGHGSFCKAYIGEFVIKEHDPR